MFYNYNTFSHCFGFMSSNFSVPAMNCFCLTPNSKHIKWASNKSKLLCNFVTKSRIFSFGLCGVQNRAKRRVTVGQKELFLSTLYSSMTNVSVVSEWHLTFRQYKMLFLWLYDIRCGFIHISMKFSHLISSRTFKTSTKFSVSLKNVWLHHICKDWLTERSVVSLKRFWSKFPLL